MLLTEIVRFRLSKAERKEIEKMAKQRNISISDLMGQRVFGGGEETSKENKLLECSDARKE